MKLFIIKKKIKFGSNVNVTYICFTKLKYMSTANLQEGKYYEIDYKKGRSVFLYQGQDLGRNYTFVNDKAMYKVSEKWISSINAKLIENE